MAASRCCVSSLKLLAVIVLSYAICAPLYYGSTNLEHIRLRSIHSLLSTVYSFVPDPDRPTLTPEYRAFERMLRGRPLFRVDPTLDPLELAKRIRKSFPLDSIAPISSSCHVDQHVYEYDGHKVDTHWIHHNKTKLKINADRIILYFHGGGYIAGDVQAYSGFECHLSELLNVTVIHIEYRLVPEHPLPAAIEDAFTVYRALLKDGIQASQVVIMGDSAGGGLTLLTVQGILNHQLPMPRAAITMSPWADFTVSGHSYTRNRATDLMIEAESIGWGIERILGHNHENIARDDPSLSPLFGSFKGFPPLYITVGTAELLEDDSRQVEAKARVQGVDVTLEVGQHLMHVHPLFYAFFPEARNTLDNIRRWFQLKFPSP